MVVDCDLLQFTSDFLWNFTIWFHKYYGGFVLGKSPKKYRSIPTKKIISFIPNMYGSEKISVSALCSCTQIVRIFFNILGADSTQ